MVNIYNIDQASSVATNREVCTGVLFLYADFLSYTRLVGEKKMFLCSSFSLELTTYKVVVTCLLPASLSLATIFGPQPHCQRNFSQKLR